MKTQTFFDKTKWPERGHWDNEPDKAQWTDEQTGLACLMVRAHGHWCGYVGVTEGHPAFNRDYNDVDVSVHGGLTFAGMCQDGDDSQPRICHTPEPGQSEHVYWLGFDCAHSGDKNPATDERIHQINLKYGMSEGYEHYRDFDYVRCEVGRLAEQLAALALIESQKGR